MNKYCLLIFFGAVLAVSCKEERRESGEDKSSPAVTYNNVSDSVYDEWGQPAPPPEVDGDGSSLFEERRKKHLDMDVEGEDNMDDQSETTIFQYDDVIRNRISSPSSYSTPSTTSNRTSSKPKPTSHDSYSLDFNVSDNNDHAVSSETKVTTLPFAANDQEKMDFIRSFYKTAFTKGVNMVDEDVISISCRNYLLEECYGNHNSLDSYFGPVSLESSQQKESLYKAMTVKPIGDDWFKVDFGNAEKYNPVELRIVEIDRKLMVDMVR